MDRSWWRVLTKRGTLVKGTANHFSILALRAPWTVGKGKTWHWRWTPQVGRCPICYWRNNSRKNEETEPKIKQCPVVDVTGDGSKVQRFKEQYCIGTWKVRSMSAQLLQSCLTLGDPLDCWLLCPWVSLGKNTGVGCNALLHGIFPTQGSNLFLGVSPASKAESLPLSNQVNFLISCGIFPDQGLNLCPLHCRQILNHWTT